MPPIAASIVFVVGVLGLMYLDRDKKRLGSIALWLPTAWIFFCSSRSLAQWLGLNYPDDQATAYLDGSPVDRDFLILLEVIALIVVVSRGRRVILILRKNWAITVFFFYAALSMFWSDFPFVTLKHWTKGIGDVMMIMIVLTEPSTTSAIKIVFTRLGFVLIPLSLLLIWYYPALGRTHSMDWTPEAVGVTTQKNGLGELCDVFGLALLWRFRGIFVNRKAPNRKWLLLAFGSVLAMDAWLLHLCNSVTSICALSIASAVMLLSTQAPLRRKPGAVHVLVAGVLVCTLYALFFQSSGALIQGLGRNSTLTGRTEVWPQLVGLVKNPFVGVGYESFWLGPRLQAVWVIMQGLHINEAHNGYVELLLTLGWIGEVLFGVLIVTGYQNLISIYRRDPDSGSLRIAWFLAAIITGLTEAAFRMMSPCWIALLFATAAVPPYVAGKVHRGSVGTDRARTN